MDEIKELESLIKKLLSNPIDFSKSDFNRVFELNIAFKNLRYCIKEIFDLSDEELLKRSDPSVGKMGKMNEKSHKKRQKIYKKKLLKRTNSSRMIFSEGDSWFQFPKFICEIIDQLNKNDKNIIFCESFAGDWFSNILYTDQIIPGLSRVKPDYFLISGGGNDLVSDYQLSIMIQKEGDAKHKHTNHSNSDIMFAQPYISKDFYAFIWVLKIQYKLLFDNLYSENNKHKNVKTITHGYANVIPSNKWNFQWGSFIFKPLVNKMLGNGKWLLEPMLINGITDSKLQKAIMKTMIYEFNEMFIELANTYDNVYHIDCREIAKSDKNWFDELHLTSNSYKKVAEKYEKLMYDIESGRVTGKVY